MEKENYLNYPKFRIERRISIPKQVFEETLEIEPSSLKKAKMLQPIDYTLRVLHCSILLSLNLHQEPTQLIGVHHAIIGILVEYLLNVRRRLRCGEAEPPPEEEAHSVGLIGHGIDQDRRQRPLISHVLKKYGRIDS